MCLALCPLLPTQKGKCKSKSMHSVEGDTWSEQQQREPPDSQLKGQDSEVLEITTGSASQAMFGTLDVNSVFGDT